MIPYVPQPVWNFGPVSIHAFGVFAALALLTGYWLVLKRASRYGIDLQFAGAAFCLVVVSGLIAGSLWANVNGHSGMAESGLVVGGSMALALTTARDRSHFWRILDLFAYAFPSVLAIARIGCFLAHDHIGMRTNAWIGVRFPGGTRFDLGLLYAIAAFVAAGLVLWLGKLALPAGAVFGATLAMVAASKWIVLGLAEGPVLSDRIAAVIGLATGTFVFAMRSWIRTAEEAARPEVING